MTDPVIRDATPADLEPLHALVESAYRGDSARRGWSHEADLLDGQRTDAQELKTLLADTTQVVLVAEASGELVGCVVAADKGQGTAYLGMLSVDPDRQAGGLGRRLVGAAEAVARERFGAGRMEMTVIHSRAELIAWYERLGYRLTGERRPFPMQDPRFGLPRVDDLTFVVLTRDL
ncbi:GNAT family N-acetyltransferase [Brevundimonas sp.]|uniref:GNAT family N-acetyltransferase n=1 Tax=Brevundimonas sp. TaxID=1871086 RepID=UPI003F71306A